MKRSILLSLIFMSFVSMWAQDDDLYFTPTSPTFSDTESYNHDSNVYENEPFEKSMLSVYNINSRDDDEYNRRYVGGMGYQTEGGSNYDYESNDTIFNTDSIDDGTEDYEYSRRILRFHSPRVGIALSSPYYWDLVYNYGIYDYMYDAYYDPFFYTWGWRYGWSWGPWSSWYGPFWGWHHPYAWSYWGWGHGWHHGRYAWNHGRYSNRGGGIQNRFDKGERIRTNTLANGGNASLSRGTFGSRSNTLASRSNLGTTINRNNRSLANRNNIGGRSSYSDYSNSRSQSSQGGRSTLTRQQSRPTLSNRGTEDRRTYSRPSSSRTITPSNSNNNVNRSVSTPSRSNYSSSRPSYSGSSNRSIGGSFGGSRGGSSFGGGSRGGGGFGGGGGRGGGRR